MKKTNNNNIKMSIRRSVKKIMDQRIKSAQKKLNDGKRELLEEYFKKTAALEQEIVDEVVAKS